MQRGIWKSRKWKLETETGNRKQKWKRNLLALVVVEMLLVFVTRHPIALFSTTAPTSSVMCDGLVFLTWIIVYVLYNILCLVFNT